ncbi:phage tail sheath family protein, partial [Undibacterium sp. SXout7W]
MAYKTPSVYIVEKNAFPDSVVEVATAVPAFLGYTQKADNKGISLAGRPWRITSFSEFVDYYGGAPKYGFNVRSKTLMTAVTTDKAGTKAVAVLEEGNATGKQNVSAQDSAAVDADFTVNGVDYLVEQNAG